MVWNAFVQKDFVKMILRIALVDSVQLGRRKDNQSIRDVGYDDNIIKSQFSVRPIADNVQGTSKFNNINDTPLPKQLSTFFMTLNCVDVRCLVL